MATPPFEPVSAVGYGTEIVNEVLKPCAEALSTRQGEDEEVVTGANSAIHEPAIAEVAAMAANKLRQHRSRAYEALLELCIECKEDQQ